MCLLAFYTCVMLAKRSTSQPFELLAWWHRESRKECVLCSVECETGSLCLFFHESKRFSVSQIKMKDAKVEREGSGEECVNHFSTVKYHRDTWRHVTQNSFALNCSWSGGGRENKLLICLDYLSRVCSSVLPKVDARTGKEAQLDSSWHWKHDWHMPRHGIF